MTLSIYKHENTHELSPLLRTSVISVCLHRCQTHPCEECEYQGHSHAVGERWRSDPCQLCHCLPNLTVRCSHYCPYTTGCPQVRGDIMSAHVSTICVHFLYAVCEWPPLFKVFLFVQGKNLVPGEGDQCCYCQGKSWLLLSAYTDDDKWWWYNIQYKILLIIFI